MNRLSKRVKIIERNQLNPGTNQGAQQEQEVNFKKLNQILLFY